MTETYLQVATALVVVVGLILVFGLVMRKRQGKTSLITVLAYQSFGPRKGIAALKIGPEILLIGVTSTDLKLLKTLDENELEPEIQKEVSDKLQKLRSMKKLLNRQ
jgi:flagellar biogenesis protein FliO